MAQGDTLRYIGVGRQAAKGTAATTIRYLDFVTAFTHKPGIKKEIPKFLTNRRNMKKKGYTQTRVDEVTISGQVDSTEFGYLLYSAAGVANGPTTNVWAWLFGQSQTLPVDASNSMLLTTVFGEGLALSWSLIDCRVAKLVIKYEATGNITFEATLRGLVAVVGDELDPTYTPPDDNTPFHPWQAILTINGDVACVVSFEFEMDNHYDPFYCSPSALPGAGAPHGLAPKRFTEGEADGKWNAVVEFLTYYTGQPFYDAERDVEENWVLEAIDPDTDLGGGVVPRLKIIMPRAFGDQPSIDRTKPNVLQQVSGDLLEDDSLGGPAQIELTNALGAYPAD